MGGTIDERMQSRPESATIKPSSSSKALPHHSSQRSAYGGGQGAGAYSHTQGTPNQHYVSRGEFRDNLTLDMHYRAGVAAGKNTE